MSWKYLAQTSLSDALVKRHEALEEMGGIRQLIVWKPTGQQMSGIHGKKRGGAAGLPLLVFKALLLQGWYGLGDPKLEKQLARDSMSRRSVNLGLSEGVPDHGTVWRFRNMLAKQGLPETLLAEINQPLSAKGLYIKTGEAVIVDATVIEARQSRRPRKGKDGGTPRTQDSEAGHNVKVAANGKKASTYGNKAHANVDGGGFIKAIGHTPGNGHDPQSLKKLLTRTEHRL
ncbi:transposase, partial [Methyloglobulus sp.]|uniref:transposase n=1 Tax=Methyloglobulus sp. TaxID=2518622 RepID=UPI0039895562